MKKKIFLVALLAFVSGCRPYEKEIPTGKPLAMDKVYTHTSYDFAQIKRVLLLPIHNLREQTTVSMHRDKLELLLLSNFAKIGLLEVEVMPYSDISSHKVVNLTKNEIDRALIGAISQEYHVDAVMHMSILNFNPFPSMQLHIRAVLLDSQTGQTVWSLEQVFDQNDANMINGMRYWWNKKRAGGFETERFAVSSINPQAFVDYCYYEMANTLAAQRIKNKEDIAKIGEPVIKKRKNVHS